MHEDFEHKSFTRSFCNLFLTKILDLDKPTIHLGCQCIYYEDFKD